HHRFRARHTGPVSCARPAADLSDVALVDVYAWRMAAPRRQHALPLDIRRQRRRPDGALEIPDLLSTLRVSGQRDAHLLRPEFADPVAGSFGSDCWRFGSVS